MKVSETGNDILGSPSEPIQGQRDGLRSAKTIEESRTPSAAFPLIVLLIPVPIHKPDDEFTSFGRWRMSLLVPDGIEDLSDLAKCTSSVRNKTCSSTESTGDLKQQ